MKKKEFMEELKEALSGRVSSEVYYDTVQYYEDYFKRQMAEGKTEEQVTASLGSGRLIAKTIIETSGNAYGDTQYFEMPDGEKRKKKSRNTTEKEHVKGWHINIDETGKTSVAFGRLDFGTVIGKLVLAFLLVLILAVILFIFFLGVKILLYIVLPVALILLVVNIIITLFSRS